MSTHRSHDDFVRAVAALRGPPDRHRRLVAQWLNRACSDIAAAPELRFFIDGTRNLGHQSATVNLARRLVELTGFRGLSTFVYADYRRELLGDVAEKITLLMPGVDLTGVSDTSGRDAQLRSAGEGGASECGPRIRDVGRWGSFHALRFVALERANELPRCRFGFTGGADDLSMRYARALEVEWFVRLQPFLWDDEAAGKSDPFYESSRIEHHNGAALYLCDEIAHFRRLFIRRAANRDDPVSVFGSELISRVRAVRSDAATAIWPVYGLQHFPSCAESILRTLIAAATAFAHRTARRVLIVSFCPMKLPVDERYDCTPRGPDPGTAWRDQVGVVQPGLVDAPTYRTILASSELPPIVEGQESVSLMMSSGRPFLQLRRPERILGYRYADIEPSAPLAPWLDTLALELGRGGITGDPDGVMVERLCELLLRCHSGDTEVSRFFSGLARGDRHDKLEVALAALALLLAEESAGSSVQKE